MIRLNEIKIYEGKEVELPSKLPSGDLFICTDSNKVYVYINKSPELLNPEGGGGGTPTSSIMLDISGSENKTNRYCFGVHPNINNGNYFSGYRSTVPNPSSDADFDILGFSS